jgi:probable HAF family extracellular repeat protein
MTLLLAAAGLALGTTGGTAAAATTVSGAGSSALTFQVRPLGISGRATAVNVRGVVVGQTGDNHAFRWDPRTRVTTDLGTLGGFGSAANGINRAGLIVGEADRAGGATRAFLWNPVTRTMSDLGTLGGANSRAFAINDLGVVVGDADTATGETHAFRWSPRTRTMTDLGTLGGAGSHAAAINNLGQIVGDAATTAGTSHAFLWSPFGRHMIDLGTGGQTVSFATGINLWGEVVGYTNDVGDFTDRAVVWLAGTHRLVGVPGLTELPSRATAVNDFGAVAGSFAASPAGSTTEQAFAWTPRPWLRGLPQALPGIAGQTFASPYAVLDNLRIYGNVGEPVVWVPGAR